MTLSFKTCLYLTGFTPRQIKIVYLKPAQTNLWSAKKSIVFWGIFLMLRLYCMCKDEQLCDLHFS